MRHLTALLDPGYDEDAFKPVGGRMRLFGGGGGKAKPPAAPAPEKPPQAAKSPAMGAARTKAAAGVSGGPGGAPSGTFQSGPSGIDDNDLLLGKNKLLGQ